MAINATTDTIQRDPIPAGNYQARCYSMIHIGTIEGEYMGEKKKQNKVNITFELPTELKVFKEDKGEQPCVISKEYTLSMYDKSSLRKDLAGWRGKDFTEDEAKCFDISVLIGKPCMLNIIHKTSGKGNVYATIASISSIPKGLKVEKQINPPFELSYDKWDEEKFNSLPDFLKDKIKVSDEYKQMKHPEAHELNNSEETQVNNNPEDDLPF